MIEHAYIHIPFCIRKCNYCSFVSGENIQNKDIYLSALFKEIEERYKGETLKTLYIGGGTPSLLSGAEIAKIIDKFVLSKDSEVTIEINPETVFLNKMLDIKFAGVNRVSLGVQSFNNEILKSIGRLHTNVEIYKAIEIIKNSGFSNLSLDLIYGLPNQTFDILNDDLNSILNCEVQHISTYGLKIEEDSKWGKSLPVNIPDDDMQAEMFEMVCNRLRKNNFIHYEISNFAMSGYESKHNCAYWKNKEYYGFGLNASGFEKNIRYKNQSDFVLYVKNPLLKETEEILSIEENLENEIFLALRMKEGINIPVLNKKYGIDFKTKYQDVLNKYKNTNLIELTENKFFLTEQGFLLSNSIMCEFIS